MHFEKPRSEEQQAAANSDDVVLSKLWESNLSSFIDARLRNTKHKPAQNKDLQNHSALMFTHTNDESSADGEQTRRLTASDAADHVSLCVLKVELTIARQSAKLRAESARAEVESAKKRRVESRVTRKKEVEELNSIIAELDELSSDLDVKDGGLNAASLDEVARIREQLEEQLASLTLVGKFINADNDRLVAENEELLKKTGALQCELIVLALTFVCLGAVVVSGSEWTTRNSEQSQIGPPNYQK